MINEEKKTRPIYVDSKGPSKSLNFLYKNLFGRVILKLLVNPIVSKLGGAVLSTSLSSLAIQKFVKNNNIDMNQYEQRKFRSYNDFFTRKVLDGKRNVCIDKYAFISPCDSKLSAYKITNNSTFNIKGSDYTIKDLLNGDKLYKEYINGTCLIFRLSVDDYHRYCYIDNGYQEKNIFIKGKLHTVQSIALERYNIYKTNCREYTILHTQNFGDVIQVEVGALLVGKILNLHEDYAFKKGEEKGMFEFGGSTIVVLLKENSASIDEEIFENTRNGNETIVKYGERIGTKC